MLTFFQKKYQNSQQNSARQTKADPGVDNLSGLHSDILKIILTYLDLPSLKNIRRVNRRFYDSSYVYDVWAPYLTTLKMHLAALKIPTFNQMSLNKSINFFEIVIKALTLQQDEIAFCRKNHPALAKRYLSNTIGFPKTLEEIRNIDQQLNTLNLELIKGCIDKNENYLDLSAKRLTRFPGVIISDPCYQEFWEKLTSINCSNNLLIALPPEIGQLKGLDTLYCHKNKLTALPPELGELVLLNDLDCSDNQLTALPPEIGQLKGLGTLRCSKNKLTALPPEIGQLKGLDTLDCSKNELTALPPEIGQLKALGWLNCRSNRLTTLPLGIGQKKLVWLDCSSNQLSALPPEIGESLLLEELYCSNNQLTILPPELGKQVGLQELICSNNQLTCLPPEIGQLEELYTLDCSHNQLTDLPPEIQWLKNLHELDCSHNQLTALPCEIGYLGHNLVKLLCSHNQLTALVPQIGHLESAEELDFSHNQLTALPPQIRYICNSENLKIDCSYNQLTALPSIEDPHDLKNIKEKLDYTHNPLAWEKKRKYLRIGIKEEDRRLIIEGYRRLSSTPNPRSFFRQKKKSKHAANAQGKEPAQKATSLKLQQPQLKKRRPM